MVIPDGPIAVQGSQGKPWTLHWRPPTAPRRGTQALPSACFQRLLRSGPGGELRAQGPSATGEPGLLLSERHQGWSQDKVILKGTGPGALGDAVPGPSGGPHPVRPSSTCSPGCPQAQGSLRSWNSAVLAQPRGPGGQEGPRPEWTHGDGQSWGHRALEEAVQPGGQGGRGADSPLPGVPAAVGHQPPTLCGQGGSAHGKQGGQGDPGQGVGSPLMGWLPRNSALWARDTRTWKQCGPQGRRRGKDSSSVFPGELLPHQVLSSIVAEPTCIPLGVQLGPRAFPREGSPQMVAWAEEERPPRTTAWRLRDG